MKIWNLFGALCIATMAIAPLPAVANISDMLDMSEKLDQIEKQDFQAAIDKANNCTQARDFACTNAQIGKAAKSASDSRDQQALVTARQNLANEKLRIAEEARLRAEEARRLAVAEERLRVAQAERQRIAQAEQQQQAEQSESGGFQWGKALVMMGTGVVAGGHMSSAAQGKYFEGVLKDSMPGQDGISNTTANANAFAAEQQARQNLAAQQARVQQANAVAAEAANNERLLKAARESRQTNGGQQQSAVQPSAAQQARAENTRSNAGVTTILGGNTGATNVANTEKAKTYLCSQRESFTSSIHYLNAKVETFTFEEACARAQQQASDFVGRLGRNQTGYGNNMIVKNIEACRKTNHDEEAVVYVNMEEPSSSACGTTSGGMAR